VVVDHVEDLIDRAAIELDVGHVGLPGLIGELGREPLERALRALVGFEGDEAPGLEHPEDRRDRRRGAVSLREVEVDGGSPRIESVIGEFLVHRHDLVLVEVGDAGRRAMGPSGAGFEPGGTLEAVAAEQLEEPAGTHVVGGRQLLDRASGPQMCLDQEFSQVHRSTPPLGGVLCLDTCPAPVSYVLNSDTVARSRRA
jgi:hypothetical protein